MKILNDMKERNALRITAEIIGALQMSNGRIGYFATLISQKAKM